MTSLRYLLLAITASLLIISCRTNMEAELPAPVIENVTFTPPVPVPGAEGEMTITVQLDRKQPLSMFYDIFILDGGALEFDRNGYGSMGNGAGARIRAVTPFKMVTLAFTAPDEPGEYRFAIEAWEDLTPDKTATDTVAVTVSR